MDADADSQLQRLPTSPPPLPPCTPPPQPPQPPQPPSPPGPPPPPPSPPVPPPPPGPPRPPAKAGTADIRSKVGVVSKAGTGLVQLTYELGGITYYLYTSTGGFAGTLDKTYPGTWWQIGLDSPEGPTNAVTIYSSYSYQAYVSHSAVIQVMDTYGKYPTRIWWYFYEAGNGTTTTGGAATYRIGNAQGKQVMREFLSLNGVYTRDGATAFAIRPSTEPVPPPGTADVRDKVGKGPVQLSYLYAGATRYYAYAGGGEGVSYTTNKDLASTWWTVGGFDAAERPAATAVTSTTPTCTPTCPATATTRP